MSRAELLQVVAALLGAAASIIAAAEVRLVKKFRDARAFAAETAISYPKLIPLMRWKLRRLLCLGAVRQTEDGRIFLDENQYSTFRKQRRIKALTVASVFVVTTAVILLTLG